MRKAFYTALGATLLTSTVLIATPVWADANPTATATATTTTQPAAAPVAGKGNHKGGPVILKLANKLNLTQQQRDQIKTIVQNARPHMADLMNQAATSEKALHDAMNSDQYDAAQIKTLATQKGAVIAQMIEARADMHHQIMAVLTADQKAQLKKMLDQERAKWQARQDKAGE